VYVPCLTSFWIEKKPRESEKQKCEEKKKQGDEKTDGGMAAFSPLPALLSANE